MQAQDLFPQVQKLPLTERLALLSFLVQLIQQEVVISAERQQPLASSLVGLAKTTEAASIDAAVEEIEQTVLERMGGMPEYLLSEGDLSDRDIRRQVVADRIQARYDHL